MFKQLGLGLLSLVLLPSLAMAEESALNSDDCVAAQKAVARKFYDVKDVVLVRTRSSSEFTRSGAPEGYRGGVSFVIDGKGVGAFMRSPKLMTSLAIDVVKKCNVATVNFGVDRSSWGQTIGVFDGGKVQPFKCIEDVIPDYVPGDRRQVEIPYGVDICSL